MTLIKIFQMTLQRTRRGY